MANDPRLPSGLCWNCGKPKENKYWSALMSTVLKLNDQVTITIPQENREWGYNPCPDGTVGTVGTVVSFGEIDYGYANSFGVECGIHSL